MVCVPFRGAMCSGFGKDRDAARGRVRTDRYAIDLFITNFLWKLEVAVVT